MYGVPLGSVLGPILFVLYATLVSDIIHYHSLHHESLADDTQLRQSAHITELDQLISRIQESQESQTSKHGRFITNHGSMMTKRNLCSLHLKSFTTILLSLFYADQSSRCFSLHLFAASVSFSTKHCLSRSMS